MKQEYKLEREATGVYVVRWIGDSGYSPRIGYITGGKNVWLADMGRYALGYSKTRKAAMEAIIEAYEMPISELQKQISNNWHEIR